MEMSWDEWVDKVLILYNEVIRYKKPKEKKEKELLKLWEYGFSHGWTSSPKPIYRG